MADPNIDTIPEDEELMMDDDEEFAGDMLLSVLTTDEGDSIATVLAKVASATDAIGKHLEKQNLILVKILSAMQAKPVTGIAAPA
jgi:hypothetical protein